MTLPDALARLVDGAGLSEAEMGAVTEVILAGRATPAQIGALLVALRVKGESIDELVGAARAMRAHAVPVPGVPADAIDTCGTGGDGASTVNVSTAAALVVAGAGVPVAKHGNRAVTGSVGGGDVLEALGVRLELPPAVLGACLREVGFAFLYAPAFHPAMRHAAQPRRDLGVRTIFNLLGPLTNPAGVRRQVIGVFARRWVEPVAEALLRLDVERAWVVHGAGGSGEGVDELALDGESAVAVVHHGIITHHAVSPADAGLSPAGLDALRVGSRDAAAAAVRDLLDGARGPARDIVCLNAAAALVVAGVARDLRDGAGTAAAAIDSGAAAGVLDRLRAFTTRHAEVASA